MSTTLQKNDSFSLTSGGGDALFNSHTVEIMSPVRFTGHGRAGSPT
ncbi:hypothetical protein FHT97_003835 [Rhizobium sp. BK399]|nr:hypothetical protein [Rhizobium sp. BK181]MBB3543088.1 hypothetical protein [Rhizobium sp. BK399]MCS3742303.1 hypothetical protein [Rhizobium sp. BK661]